MQDYIHGSHLTLKAPEGEDIVKALVTPAVAQAWLDTQVKNRPVQRASMLSYRADMIAGRWTYTANPICFDWDGHLIDGQNRLEALAGVEMRNMALIFAVARGLDPDAQMFMDQGARRTAGQQLGLKGITSGTAIAAGVRMAMVWERGHLFTDRWSGSAPVTPTEVIEWTSSHPEAVELCQRFLARVRQIGLRPSTGLAFVVRVGAVMPEELDLFFNEMHSLENLQPGSPTLAFAKRISRTRQDANLVMSDVAQLGFLIRTWNAWVNGTTRLRLQTPTGGFDADNFPRVDGL